MIAFVIEKSIFDGRVYNVVTANATVRQVIDHVREHVEELQVDFVESRVMNKLSYEVLNTRMNAAGFFVERNFSQGISDTINLLKNANVR